MDANRTGARAGWTWRSRSHYRLGMDARNDSGGSSGDAETYTVNLGASDFTKANLGLSGRTSYYANDRAEGWLRSLSAATDIGRRVRLQIGGGTRDETLLAGTVAVLPGIEPDRVTSVTWYSADLDLNLGRHWYLLVSAERTASDVEETDQLYGAVTYRF